MRTMLLLALILLVPFLIAPAPFGTPEQFEALSCGGFKLTVGEQVACNFRDAARRAAELPNLMSRIDELRAASWCSVIPEGRIAKPVPVVSRTPKNDSPGKVQPEVFGLDLYLPSETPEGESAPPSASGKAADSRQELEDDNLANEPRFSKRMYLPQRPLLKPMDCPRARAERERRRLVAEERAMRKAAEKAAAPEAR